MNPVARLTPVDADGVPCGEPFFVTVTDLARIGDDFSVSLPAGATLSERYWVERWIQREPVCERPGPYEPR